VNYVASLRQKAGKCSGFTLIEVLVALGMVAVALTAGARATYALTNNVSRQSNVLLAHLCVENEIIKMRLSRQMPNVGDSTVACEQSGRTVQVSVSVLPTLNTEFRRVDVKASESGSLILQLSTVVTRY
jgi:general secretion pathway protein I